MIIFLCRDGDIGTDELVAECLKIYIERTGADGVIPYDARIKRINGKPFFENLDIYFSYTDTERLQIVAMSRNNVGVDAEYIRDVRYKRIADRFFTHGEALSIKKPRDFFNIWTAKEAYSKYTALGIASFRQFDIKKISDIFVTRLEVGENYSAHCVSADNAVEYYDMSVLLKRGAIDY
jgi:phosphopantetheinyl transferase